MDAFRLRQQRARLGDAPRMRAYRRAIEAVCRGRVVCEIGAGLGALSLLALRAGAARAYAIERDPELLALAETVLARAGFGASRFVPVPGSSTDVELPERADVVVTGLLDRCGVSTRMHFALEDARHRLAKPEAVFVPSWLQRHAALARPRMFKAELEFWDADLFLQHGLDYGDMVDVLREHECGVRVRPDELASEWVPLPRLELADRASYGAPLRARFRVRKPGPVTGVALAFESGLGGEIQLGTLPGRASLDWELGFRPLPEPIACGEGDLVDLELGRVSARGARAGFPRARRVPAPRVEAFLAAEAEAEARTRPVDEAAQPG